LQIESLKAGLGDCQGYLFKRENNKIIGISSDSNANEAISFVDQKELLDRPYDKLSKEEQVLFDESMK
jgi:hypothetical protein